MEKFKFGDKVVCTRFTSGLTIGNQYEVIRHKDATDRDYVRTKDHITVISDNGSHWCAKEDHFDFYHPPQSIEAAKANGINIPIHTMTLVIEHPEYLSKDQLAQLKEAIHIYYNRNKRKPKDQLTILGIAGKIKDLPSFKGYKIGSEDTNVSVSLINNKRIAIVI